jgi:uncharacterized membrane protein
MRREVSVSQSIRAVRSGPLPDAAELQRYNQITPGLADRIVAMAEKEQGHRHSLQTTVVAGEHKRQARGQLYALAATVVLSGVATTALMHGAEKIGCTALGVIAACIGAFLLERRAERKADAEKEAAERADSSRSKQLPLPYDE